MDMAMQERNSESNEELRQKVEDFTWAMSRIVELLTEYGGESGALLSANVLSQVQAEWAEKLNSRKGRAILLTPG